MPRQALSEAIRPADLVVRPSSVRLRGLPLRPHSPLVQTAQVVTNAALVVQGPSSLSRPLVVANADTDAIRRAVSAWRHIHPSPVTPVNVVSGESNRNEMDRALSGIGTEIRLQEPDELTPSGVIRLARSLASDVLIIAADGSASADAGYVEELVARAESQVLLLR